MRYWYKTIDELPILVFDKIKQTGDLTLLLHGYKPFWVKIDLEKVWENIEDQFNGKFGVSEKLTDYFRYIKEACNLYKSAYVDGNRVNLTMAQIMEQRAKDLFLFEGKPISIHECWASILKQGYNIDLKKTTVLEFYSIIEHINKTAKEIKDYGQAD